MSDTDINVTVNVTEDIYPDVDSTAVSAAVIDDGDSIVVPAEVDFGDTLDAELEDENLIDVPVDESVGIQGDHRVLLHRDAANQHPMSAITGLGDALDAINTELSSRIGQVEAESAELEVDMASALLRIGDLQDQVDGNITTWFYAAEPAMNLPPVAYDPSNPHDTGWDTPEKKNAHKGDLYYNTLTGYAYRFAYADGDYGWMRITDTDVVKALADAARAQDTADSKRRVFYSTPYPPYDKGDLWVQGSSGDILVCTTSKPADGSYSESDWSSASKYTDDYVANIALASANSKNTVYHQPSQPTGGTYKKGDTWFDSDDDYTMYTYDGALWIKEQFGNEAIADASITNAKIQDATIEYAKIKSVDAGKITVGDISADRMKVNSISAINGNTGTVKINANKVDITGTAVFNAVSGDASAREAMLNSNVKIGTRNYAITSLGNIPIGTTETRQSGVTATLVGPATIKLNGTATSNDWFFSSSNVFCGVTLEVGTYAFWATTPNVSLRIGKGSDSTYFGALTLGSKDNPYLLTIAESDIYWFTPNCAAGKSFSNQTVQIMIEKGNKASDWTPAPEDVQAEIDAKKSTHILTSSSAGASYSSILSWAEEGHSGNWAVTSNTGVKIGDNVRLAYKATDMGTSGTIVYVIGTVTSIPNSTSITMTSHGLDTTVIDGGHILTGTIDASKVNVSNLTVGSFGNTEQDKILNSNIKVGGRNLLIERNGHPSGGSFANHTLTNTVADAKTSMQLMIQAYNGSTYEGAVLGGQAITSTGKYVKTFNSERAVSAGRTLLVKHSGSTKDIGYNFILSEGIASGEQLTISFTVQSNNPSSIGGLIVKNIQLERGNVATDWSPAVEDRDESQTIYYSTDAAFANPPTSWVTYTGKNLVSIDLPAATVGGVTYTPSNDYVRANGTINSTAGYRLCPDFTLPAGTYYAWCGGATANGVRAVFYIGGRYYDVTTENRSTITLSSSATGYVYLRGETSGTTVNNAILKPMLYSSTEPSHDYEPYIGWNAIWTTKRPRYRSNFPNVFVATQTRMYDGTITCTTPQRDDTTTRSRYVTHIDDNGIRVHPSATENNSVVINANGMEVFKGGTGSANSVAFYGDTARVGKAASHHITIETVGSSAQMRLYQDATVYPVYLKGAWNDGSIIFLPSLAPSSSYMSDLACYSYDSAGNAIDMELQTAAKTASVLYLNARATNLSKSVYLNLGVGDAQFGNSGAIKASHSISVTSDRRIKTHIAYLQDDAIRFVRKLKPVHFKIYDGDGVGFYAQDVEEADEWHCLVSGNELKSLNYSGLIAPLVTYCQHLEERIAELERSR